MQVLDSFISPISGLDGDILILTVLVSAQPHSDEPTNDPSAKANVGASKTQASKWKATANLTTQKKAKKAMRRSSSRIKINEPTPKAPTLSPS
jgi:hypothetical protein